MKKSLIALCLVHSESFKNGFAVPPVPYGKAHIKPARVAALKQHPSLRAGKSGVAAAKRAARKRRAKKC